MNAIALSRPYPCRIGGPVLAAAETRIFTLRYFRDCLGCGFCSDACCDHGVDIDLGNVGRLLAAPQSFKDMVGVPEAEWFAAGAIPDDEFPTGRHTRTAVRNGACVFRDRVARGCMIHRWCLEQGEDYHHLKPIVSVLFPLTFDKGILSVSAELADGSLVCSGGGATAYDGVRDELHYYFGADLVAELDAIRAAHLP